MAAPKTILQRLQAHTARIQRMLTPGLKNPGGRMTRLSAVLPWFGGAKYKQGLRQIHFLDKYRLGSLRPDSIDRLKKTLSDQLKNPRSLLHFRPARQDESKLWPEIERSHPVQKAASESGAQPDQNILRPGSIIQKFQTVPKPGQDAESFKKQVQSSPSSQPTPSKPRKTDSRPQNIRPYSRVEEVTGRKEEPVEIPVEEVKPSSPADSPIPAKESVHPVVSQDSDTGATKTAPPSKLVKPTGTSIPRPANTVQRQPEKRPEPAITPPSPHKKTIQDEHSSPTPKEQKAPPQIEAGISRSETTSRHVEPPRSIPAAAEDKTPAAEKPLLKALPVKKVRESEPIKEVLKATPRPKETPVRQVKSRVLPKVKAAKPSTPQDILKTPLSLIQGMPEASAGKMKAERAERAKHPQPQEVSSTITTPDAATGETKPGISIQKVEQPDLSVEKKATREIVTPDVANTRETKLELAHTQLPSPAPPDPLQQRLEYRKLAPAQVRFIEPEQIKLAKKQQPLVDRTSPPILSPGKQKAATIPTPVTRTFKNIQPLSRENKDEPKETTPSSGLLPMPLVLRPVLPELPGQTQPVTNSSNQALTGTVQRVMDRSSDFSPGVGQPDLQASDASKSASPDLTQLAESLLPIVKRILETESERAAGWGRSFRS